MVRTLVLLPLLMASAVTSATTFQSPNNRREECRILPAIAEGDMSEKDLAQEKEFCDVDLYNAGIALCPKTWSTSAGTIIIDAKKAGVSGQAFEQRFCGDRSKFETIAKFKTSMNQSGTSGTMSMSSIMYYKLARFLDTLVEVPVAVLRTIDKDVMVSRVASKAAGKSAMNRTAWEWIKKTSSNPAVYVPTDDIMTGDRQAFYGVMLNDKGERYGAEINSARKAAWGAPQSVEFQTTPAFAALRTDAPLEKLIQGAKYPAVQMAFWMRELSEVAVLDHIFGQQDRVGNIDYVWKFYWIDGDGKVQDRRVKSKVGRDKMNSIEVPDDIKAFNPVLLQRTWIGDNDAGLSKRYANFAKKTGMVQNLRHFNGKVYRKLQALASDIKANGPLSQHLKANFGLNAGQYTFLTGNITEVAGILRATCDAGKLRFDLAQNSVLKGATAVDKVGCDGK